MLCLVEEGDEVILGEPAYATYPGVLAAAGAAAVYVPLRPEDGFHLRVEDVAGAITPRTRAILLNSPHNPSGAVTPPEAPRGLPCCAGSKGSGSSPTRPTHPSPGHGGTRSVPRARRIGGVRCLARQPVEVARDDGFRFGWAVAPADLAARLERLLESMLFGSPSFVQDAGVAALADERATVAMREAYERRARLLCEALAGAPGLVARPPEGGMFVLVDVRRTGSPATTSRFALEEEDVAVTPVDDFGPSGAGHVRVSLGAEDERLAEAAGRMARLAARLAQGT